MGLGVDGEEKARRRAWESGFAGFFEIGSVILAVTCEKQRMMGFFFFPIFVKRVGLFSSTRVKETGSGLTVLNTIKSMFEIVF